MWWKATLAGHYFIEQVGVRQCNEGRLSVQGRCARLSAAFDQRPDFGGEKSIDKNKQTMTNPARTAATSMPRSHMLESDILNEIQGASAQRHY